MEFIEKQGVNAAAYTLIAFDTHDYEIPEKEYGKWKRCSRCGEIKLAHKLFFSTNKGSKDGWYSICKECRNKK